MRSQNRRSAIPTRTNRFRARDLGAATAALAAASPASATIISQGGLSWQVGDTFDLVLGTAGEINVVLTSNMSGEESLGLEAATMAGSTVQFAFFNTGMMGPNHFFEAFNPGDLVDGSYTYNPEGLLVSDDVAHPGWAVGDVGYAGFTFDPGTGPVFGYVTIRFDSLTDLTVLGWAYEDNGNPIVVPEPGVALLLGLGVAAASIGLGGSRRRNASPAAA